MPNDRFPLGEGSGTGQITDTKTVLGGRRQRALLVNRHRVSVSNRARGVLQMDAVLLCMFVV